MGEGCEIGWYNEVFGNIGHQAALMITSFISEVHHHRARVLLLWVGDYSAKGFEVRVGFHSELAHETPAKLRRILISAHLAVPD